MENNDLFKQRTEKGKQILEENCYYQLSYSDFLYIIDNFIGGVLQTNYLILLLMYMQLGSTWEHAKNKTDNEKVRKNKGDFYLRIFNKLCPDLYNCIYDDVFFSFHRHAKINSPLHTSFVGFVFAMETIFNSIK